MRKFFENRFAAAAILSLFSLATAWNALNGAAVPAASHILLSPDVITVAHGPLLPPDPWETVAAVRVGHGPLLPPDPWETVAAVRVGHGPLLPPDPWETVAAVRVGHGPLLPPDPWETVAVA